MKSLLSILVTLVPFISTLTMSNESESDSYISERDRMLKLEKSRFVGGQLNLTQKEISANEIILKIKKTELEIGHKNVSDFLPAQHFFDAKEKIERSEMFSIIKKLPKGGSLHTHYLAAVSIDYIMKNITYRANIYGGYVNEVFKLKFFADGDPNATSWKKLQDYRKQDKNFDSWLRNQLSLEVPNPHEAYPTADAIWTKLKKTFSTQFDMVCYRPVFEEYIYELLNELYADNVTYTELRGTAMPLYELDETVYSKRDFFEIFVKTIEKFKKKHPGFSGVKYIHSLYRGATLEVLKNELEELLVLKNEFPDFIIGFDFVGHEEEGYRLFDFRDVLLEFDKRIKFYFHAGETNWFGHTDLNLLDAILLNSSRIGHGFGLNKHPALLDLAKEKNICVELCPISNQVLKLVDDLRNHPAVNLLAEGLPIVIGNDDSAVWGATGLSYDWYLTFVAMTPEDAGIEVLKQFAINSIECSAMGKADKRGALEEWEKRWNKFLDDLITLYNNQR